MIHEARQPRLLQFDIVVVVQAVEPDNLIAALQQALRDMRTDETGGAGDQDFHPRRILTR